jgi:hypothetical protein
MAFPKADQQYALFMDVATSTADTPGGLRAIFTQVDKDRNFYAILFASRQLKDHEKNYSPLLLKAAAAVWGMDVFNEYLQGKQFILYTDHKPLEKLGHLQSKTMNQTALLEHDFIIQHQKGSNMLVNYLFWLPGTKEALSSISAFDPFQSDLYDLQMQNEHLQMLQNYMTRNEWPTHLSNMIATTSRLWQTGLFRKKTKLSGSDSQTSTIPRLLSTYQ